MNTLTCISARFDTPGFVDISSFLVHVFKCNPYVSGLFCTQFLSSLKTILTKLDNRKNVILAGDMIIDLISTSMKM